MCPGAVVILLVRAQHMPQMSLAEHDHMIEALASDGADKSFSVTVLPRRSRRCRSVANAHRANASGKCLCLSELDPEVMMVQSADDLNANLTGAKAVDLLNSSQRSRHPRM